MMFKNLTDNAKNLAANAKVEDMTRLFKNHLTGKQDVKNALSGVMDISKEVINIPFLLITYNKSSLQCIPGGEKSFTETMCYIGRCFGNNQTIFPCWW